LSQEQKKPRSKKQQAVDNVVSKSGFFYRIFTSPDGKKVLEALEEEFDADEIFTAGEPDTTSYNLGKRDVIVYIRQMIRLKENATRAELEGQSS
jgi:uncharacterized membrane protein YkgB